jgi:hypothetical protein
MSKEQGPAADPRLGFAVFGNGGLEHSGVTGLLAMSTLDKIFPRPWSVSSFNYDDY